MCLAVPSKVISVQDNTAVIDVYGAQRTISLLLMEDKPAAGDYVLVHAGFAIQKIDEDYAKETMILLDQFTALQE
jgi:hydrogenase expression/formation protein HypC